MKAARYHAAANSDLRMGDSFPSIWSQQRIRPSLLTKHSGGMDPEIHGPNAHVCSRATPAGCAHAREDFPAKCQALKNFPVRIWRRASEQTQ